MCRGGILSTGGAVQLPKSTALQSMVEPPNEDNPMDECEDIVALTSEGLSQPRLGNHTRSQKAIPETNGDTHPLRLVAIPVRGGWGGLTWCLLASRCGVTYLHCVGCLVVHRGVWPTPPLPHPAPHSTLQTWVAQWSTIHQDGG